MSTSWAPWLLQLFDNYGDVLAGGKVESYAAGTSTPLATYQDLEGLVANANPVVLDSAGRADIRFTDGVAYKIDIFDADDVLIDSKDDIVVGSASSSSGSVYLIHQTYEGTPGADAFLGGHIFTADVTIPIDFEGGSGHCQTNPASTFTISVRKNDSEIGTVSISTGGAFTFATTSHVEVSFSVGDRLTFYGPHAPGVISDFFMTIEGAVE